MEVRIRCQAMSRVLLPYDIHAGTGSRLVKLSLLLNPQLYPKIDPTTTQGPGNIVQNVIFAEKPLLFVD